MKKSKVLDKVLNVVTIIIAIIVILIAISTIMSSGKGYTPMFGKAGINVLTDSMKGDKPDSFSKGDLIYIDVLKDEEKNTLKVGEIITFYDNIEGVKALNTHRIIEVIAFEGSPIQYRTQGDANPTADGASIAASEVVGKYTGTKLKGIGSVIAFIKGPTGFMIFVVVPAFLVVVYAIYRVIKNFRVVNKEKMLAVAEGAKAEVTDEERARLKEELRLEMEREQNAAQAKSDGTSPSEQKKDDSNNA